MLLGVLQNRQTSDKFGLLQDYFQRLWQDITQATQPEAVVLTGPIALAQADHQHLGNPTLEATTVVGVRLDPRYRDDSIRFESVLIPEDWLIPGADTDLYSRHLG